MTDITDEKTQKYSNAESLSQIIAEAYTIAELPEPNHVTISSSTSQFAREVNKKTDITNAKNILFKKDEQKCRRNRAFRIFAIAMGCTIFVSSLALAKIFTAEILTDEITFFLVGFLLSLLL